MNGEVVTYGLAVLAEVYRGVVWREDIVCGSDDWARHFGDGAMLWCCGIGWCCWVIWKLIGVLEGKRGERVRKEEKIAVWILSFDRLRPWDLYGPV